MEKEEKSEKEAKSKGTSRREFIAATGAAVAGLAVGAAVGSQAFPRVVEVPGPVKTVTTTATTTTVKEVPVSVAKAKGYIAYDTSLCSGCNVCVDACSLYHFGECKASLAAITLKTYPLDAYTTEIETCRQCDSPTCMAACPVQGAMYVDEKTGARCINAEKCIGCDLCAAACEFNIQKGKLSTYHPDWGAVGVQTNTIIKQHPSTKKYFKCDLCGGDPQCVHLCPMGALSFKEVK